jgi:signal transduction histidine kinase
VTSLDAPEAGWVEGPAAAGTPANVPSLSPGQDEVLPSGSRLAARAGTDGPLEAGESSPTTGPSGDDRPWTRSGFWIIQLVVLTLYLLRLAATVAFHLDDTSLVVEFSTLALFIVPVVCAALNYGFAGAASTGTWITVLAIPRFVTSLSTHQYVAAWAELMQVVLLDGLALLIGQRVSAERAARRLAETSREAHLSAEAMYRDLFDSNQAPILIIDGDGIVVETNASAQRAFGRHELPSSYSPLPRSASPVRLVEMIGADAAARVLTQLLSWRRSTNGEGDESSTDPERVEPLPFDIEGEHVLFRPTATMLGPENGERRMQIVFEDVTAETRRHDLMEAYAARVVLGQEEERRHIAQELHDGPLQTLIHLCRQIDAVETISDPVTPSGTATPADPRAPLSGLRSIVEETVAELRSIAKGLRPSILDDLGLVASISQMVSEAGDRHGFVTSFGVTGSERRLSPTVELALFRIAQEALSNVERHSAARRVAVGMDFEAGGLRMLIKDDGVGFEASDRSDGVRSPSMGLPGMTERAHLITSRLVIHSEPGLGTTVDVWVPATILDQN